MNQPRPPDDATSTPVGTSSAAVAADPSRERRIPKWLLRRRYLVNPRRQLQAALLVVAVCFVPIAILNFSLGYARALEREVIFTEAAVELERQVWQHDRTEAFLVAAASLVYLCGVFALTILETHQTSGAALGVARYLRNIRDGHLDSRLALRDSDNLKELTEPYNQMAIALQAHSIRNAETLAELSVEASRLDGAARIAERLRELARDQERRAGRASSYEDLASEAATAAPDDRPEEGPAVKRDL